MAIRTSAYARTKTALNFFDAPSAEMLNEAGKRAALPFERISEAVEGAPSPKEET